MMNLSTALRTAGSVICVLVQYEGNAEPVVSMTLTLLWIGFPSLDMGEVACFRCGLELNF